MALFFYPPSGGWLHVLWTRNLFYKTEDGTEFAGSATYPVPRDFSDIAYDIQHTDCQGNWIDRVSGHASEAASR